MVIGQQAVRNILLKQQYSEFCLFFLSRSAEEKCHCIESKLNKMSAGILTFEVPATTRLIGEASLISADEVPVCLLSIHLFTTHNTSCTRHRGKLRPRRFAVLSLLCSDVTISRNQISCLSVLNKYIFTCHLTAPSQSQTAPFQIDRAAVYSWSICVR